MGYWKKILTGVAFSVLFAATSFAAIDVKKAGTSLCTAEHINFTAGATVSCSGNTASFGNSYAADTASTDSYTVALDPAPTAYAAGLRVVFKAVTANTGAATVNINGLGAKALKKGVATDPGDNFIKAGSIVEAVYDGTNFQMLQPAAQ